MYTIHETPSFQKEAAKLWSEEDNHAFINWLSANPLAGDVIPAANGARKVRWAVAGRGKRGGVRVIYFNLSAQGVLVLIAIYAKNEQANISINSIKNTI